MPGKWGGLSITPVGGRQGICEGSWTNQTVSIYTVESDHRRPQVLVLISGLHTQTLIHLPTHILIHMQRCVHAYLPHSVYTYRDKNKTKQETFPIVIHMSSSKRMGEVPQVWGERLPHWRYYSSEEKVSLREVLQLWKEKDPCSWKPRNNTKSHITTNFTKEIHWDIHRRIAASAGEKPQRMEDRASQGSRVEYVRFPAKSRDLWEFKLRDW